MGLSKNAVYLPKATTKDGMYTAPELLQGR